MSIAGLKKKKVSKKTKSSWRKHTDFQDVEDFLEVQRQEERIGDFGDKKDDELFAIDVKSDKKLLSEKQKRKLNALRPPKYLTALENISKVKDPLGQRNKVKLKKNGRNLEDEVLNPKKPRDIQANKDRLRHYNKVLNTKFKNNLNGSDAFKNDLWEEKDVREKLQEFNSDPISRELALHHLKNTGRPLVKVNDTTHHKTSRIKAFAPPHPGMSYNPSLKDHQELMKTVIEKEGDIIKKEKHLKRVTTNMFSKVTVIEREFEKLKELASGIPVEEGGIPDNLENDVKEEINDENNQSYIAVNPPTENKKKLRKVRRKQVEQKQISRTLQEKKNIKKQITDIHRLQHLKKDVLIEEEKTNALKKRRKLTVKQKKFQPKRLSKVKYEEPDIDINNVDDISGNLRNVKPESSLLVDRFKNLQKRNILATTVDVGIRKRKKIKRFTRSSHKEPQLPLGKKK